ncbi:hypothetical protein DFH07DRAFT_953826 [Mycena maculata]|uniref:F-box domain-containing protein n=1 Tax=Mycena maculata TaxID=230809 RepID=A0AAD7NQI2_9AGAR|nr:hypothetical protein DFH07DRAFT_953826 [Mycena maculata]
MSTEQRPHLLSIPLELLEHILLFCHPHTVAHFSSTCRFGEDLVYRSADQYFWRQLFLLLFDDPRHAMNRLSVDPASFDWKGQLVRRMKAERAVFIDTPGDRESALETLVCIAEEALPSRYSDYGDPPASRNIEWLDNVLRTSHILDVSFAPNEAQFGDRLKAYMGLSLKPESEENAEVLSMIRTQSRCFVYDLRNYHPGNMWGPYLLDGNISWSHVERIINVVETNLREQQSLLIPRPPVGLQAIRAHSAPGDFTGSDWAGVEGTWRRYVCFMDYRDLFAFNFSDVYTGPRDPAFFDDRGFREATRLIEINLHLITRDKMRVRFPTGDPPMDRNPDYPTLYMSGTSRGASSQEALVQGFVYMGQDFIPRWRFTSIHDGQPQWSSEGAQIGGVGSAMGVAGTWSAFNHGEGDPVGPFWLWKVSDEPSRFTF